jgi:phosphohistidine phosphatase
VKTLHLLRHAKAEPGTVGGSDHARALAKRGRRAAGDMAQYLGKSRVAVDRIFCSTAVRARQTLELVRPALAGVPVAFRDSLYMIEPDALMSFILNTPETADSVLLVGHNPAFHIIALQLVGEAGSAEAWRALREKFPTGALCTITCGVNNWRDVAAKSGTLASFVRPRDLA